MTDTQEQVFHTQYGDFLVSKIHDHKFFSLFAKGRFLQEEDLAIVETFITPDTIFADVGAHIGTFAVPIAKRAREVHAFEPIPKTCSYLEKNVELNKLTNLHVHSVGLGAEAEMRSAHAESSGNASTFNLTIGSPISDSDIEVPIRTLDEELQNVDVVKIDVEGMEVEVLEGARRLIGHSRPIFFFEVNLSMLRAQKTSPRALGSFFKNERYRLYLPLAPLVVGAAPNLEFLAALLYTRSWLTRCHSGVFNVLAIPCEKALPDSLQEVSVPRLISSLLYKKTQHLIRHIRNFMNASRLRFSLVIRPPST